MRLRSIAILAGSVAMQMFGVGCAHLVSRAECAAHQGSPWREVTTAHFRVKTNVDSNAARAAALNLERWRKALLVAAWQGTMDPPGRVDVILLQTPAQLREFARERIAFFTLDDDGPVMVLTDRDHFLDASTNLRPLNHELAHYLSAYVMLRQPRWVAEGFATYLETARPYGDGTEVLIGEDSRDFFKWSRTHGRSSWEQLWSWKGDDELSEDARAAHYVTSWLWVHFLVNKHPEEFGDFQLRLGRAEDPRQAWDAAFARISHDELSKQLVTYMLRSEYRALRIPMPTVAAEVGERPMSDAEVHALRARLWTAMPEHDVANVSELVEREVAEALARDPRSVEARLWQIRITPRREERLRLAREITALHPNRPESWRILTATLAGDPELQRERHEAALKAARLAPDDPITLNNLAWEYHLAKTPRAGLPLARKAVRLAPWSAPILDTYAALLADAGSCADAALVQRRAVDMIREGASARHRAPYEKALARYERGCSTEGAAPTATSSESPP